MKYNDIMKKLGVPLDRQAATAQNARWFLRNESVLHRFHPLYTEAVMLATDIVRKEELKSAPWS